MKKDSKDIFERSPLVAIFYLFEPNISSLASRRAVLRHHVITVVEHQFRLQAAINRPWLHPSPQNNLLCQRLWSIYLHLNGSSAHANRLSA
jgi:hypothetical protein